VQPYTPGCFKHRAEGAHSSAFDFLKEITRPNALLIKDGDDQQYDNKNKPCHAHESRVGHRP
jgi:hypothetical protein